MKTRLTEDQRRRAIEMLDDGVDRSSIAAALGLSRRQVAAVMAHRTMGRYGRRLTVSSRSPSGFDPPESAGAAALASAPLGKTGVVLGMDVSDGSPVVWNPYTATNPHVLVLGESGSGKTYCASRLVVELARDGLPSVVFDYGQGFSLKHAPTFFRESASTHELDLSRNGIGINPLAVLPVDTHGPATVAQRVADTLIRVYPRLGVQQHAVLRQAVVEVLADAGILTGDRNTWIEDPPPFRDLDQKLATFANAPDEATRRAASSARSHVSTLFFFNTFRNTGHALQWSHLLAANRVSVLQLGGLEPSVERAVTEFLLWSLIRYFELLGPGSLRCYVVLDEAHKLSFGSGSPVERILREGRKFGLAALLASQQPEDFSPVAFGNTATKIIFQTDDQKGHVARQLRRKITNGHSVEYISEALGTLPRGSAYVVADNAGRVTKMSSIPETDAASRPT